MPHPLAEPLAARPQRPPQVLLGEVARQVGASATTPDVVVSGLALSTRTVQPGDLFVAAPGSNAHGARFAPAAVQAGAVAVLTDGEGAALCREASVPVPVLSVGSPREVVGALAAYLYGEPASALTLLGVTGTQGKTTTARIAESLLQRTGHAAASVGTVGTRVAGREVRTALTTPEAPDLHALFAVMREQGVEACVMEVSSHALVMGRVDGVVFDVAVFTNLGRDHLDFHADVEAYFAAKAQLFTPQRSRRAVVNADDPYGRRLLAAAEVPTVGYAIEADAEWSARDIAPTHAGTAFTLHGPFGSCPAEVPLPGEFNVANAVAAVAALAEAGYSAPEVAAALAGVDGVPGRLEPVDAGQGFLAVVDYAHKPDAVEAVLRALRSRTTGRLLVVIGAGGDRDRGKRPLMGEAAARLADVVVVTDDNPRSEDPSLIRAEVIAGTRGRGAEVLEVGDRAEAIRTAVSMARAGDTLVVAGKGHETGQEAAGTVQPFDDRVVLRAALEEVAVP